MVIKTPLTLTVRRGDLSIHLWFGRADSGNQKNTCPSTLNKKGNQNLPRPCPWRLGGCGGGVNPIWSFCHTFDTSRTFSALEEFQRGAPRIGTGGKFCHVAFRRTSLGEHSWVISLWTPISRFFLSQLLSFMLDFRRLNHAIQKKATIVNTTKKIQFCVFSDRPLCAQNKSMLKMFQGWITK